MTNTPDRWGRRNGDLSPLCTFSGRWELVFCCRSLAIGSCSGLCGAQRRRLFQRRDADQVARGGCVQRVVRGGCVQRTALIRCGRAAVVCAGALPLHHAVVVVACSSTAQLDDKIDGRMVHNTNSQMHCIRMARSNFSGLLTQQSCILHHSSAILAAAWQCAHDPHHSLLMGWTWVSAGAM